ncbi:MAG: hypothetical protein KDC83_10365 [Flavobacteriales bacterium]|nr:hypothetical protein [Flavobacteriales bacterium]
MNQKGKDMHAKTPEFYFRTAQQLPLVMDLDSIRELIDLRITKQIKAPKSRLGADYWNLNTLLITGMLLGTAGAASLWFGMSQNNVVAQYTSNHQIPEVKMIPLLAEQDEAERSIEIEQEFVAELKDRKHFEEKTIESQPLATHYGNKVSNEKRIKSSTQEEQGSVWWPKEGSSKLETKLIEKEGAATPKQKEPKKEVSGIIGDHKVLVKELMLDGNSWFKLVSDGGSVTIKTWKEAKVKLTAQVSIETKDRGEQAEALADFDLGLEAKGDQIEVINKWKPDGKSSCACSFKNTKIETSEGNTIKIKNTEIHYEVFVPEDMNLNLKNNYGKIEVPDMGGSLRVNSFQGEIKIGKIAKNLDLIARYGHAYIDGAESASVQLFQQNASLGAVKTIDLNAKYSKVSLISAENMELVAFQSDINLERNGQNASRIEGSVKYGKLLFKEDVKQADLSFFQSEFEARNIDSLIFKGSYSKIKTKLILVAVFHKSFQDNYQIHSVKSIFGKTKYTSIDIEQLGSNLSIESFQGSIDVGQVQRNFELLKIDSKYTPIDVGFDPTSKYRLEANTNYTTLQYPKKDFTVEYSRNENQQLTLRGTYNEPSSRKPGLVQINGFEGRVELR